jgi:hypothetical protein
MPSKNSSRNAAQLLTTLALRPDLATRVPDLHFGLQLDYQRLVDLQERRRAIAQQLSECEAGLARLDSSVQERIVATHFALRVPGMRAA